MFRLLGLCLAFPCLFFFSLTDEISKFAIENFGHSSVMASIDSLAVLLRRASRFTFRDRLASTDHFELAHVLARKVTFHLSRADKLMLVPRKDRSSVLRECIAMPRTRETTRT